MINKMLINVNYLILISKINEFIEISIVNN